MSIKARFKAKYTLKHELTPAQLTLLAVQGVFLLGNGFSNVFINIFLWEYNNSIFWVVLYYIPLFTFTAVSFFACSYFCKKYGVVLSLRTGIFLFSTSYALLLIFGDFFGRYPYVLGILMGISSGFYYLAYNVIYFDYCKKNCDTFLSAQGIVTSASALIAPITAGFIISMISGLNGYLIVFSVSLILFLCAFLISLNLPNTYNKERTYYKSMFLLFIKNKVYVRSMSTEVLRGFREGAMMFLPPVLIYQSLNSEFLIGTYSFMASLFSIAAYVVLGRSLSPQKRKRYLLIGSISVFLISFIPSFGNHTVFLFLFGTLTSFFVPFVMNGFTPIVYETLNKLPNISRRRIEGFAIRELFINIGRLIGLIPLLITNDLVVLNILLITLGFSQVGIYLLLRND